MAALPAATRRADGIIRGMDAGQGGMAECEQDPGPQQAPAASGTPVGAAAPRLRLRMCGRTDRGTRRRLNEDAIGILADLGFCVVCDGMGGHASGEVASRMTVELLERRMREAVPPLAARTPEQDRAVRERLPGLLGAALAAANLQVYERGRSDPEIERGRPMGTTVAALALAGDRVVLAHIGDSRIYRLRQGRLQALTRDHSVITPPEAQRLGRKRKYVTRALGTRRRVRAELGATDAAPGDVFLLCTDGLTDVVHDDELQRILLAAAGDGELEGTPDLLVELANRRGGRDNVSVVVAVVEAAPPGGRLQPTVERPEAAEPPAVPPPPPAGGETGELRPEDLALRDLPAPPPPPPLEPPPG
ncbi:MAG: hypothetical protein KatS3mg102_2554 [Planctomycetota bacterium]|nr:MAG: hypothetical protein KatS3mg102_2554 [Planctomycetota bacterium]